MARRYFSPRVRNRAIIRNSGDPSVCRAGESSSLGVQGAAPRSPSLSEADVARSIAHRLAAVRTVIATVNAKSHQISRLTVFVCRF
jgi:hypothetical protein